MNFKEAFRKLQHGKAITCIGDITCYPFFHEQYFLLKEQRIIIDMHGNDVTFTMLQASFDNDLQWEIYEPTKEELLFEIVKLKKDAQQNILHRKRLNSCELGSGINGIGRGILDQGSALMQNRWKD